MCCGGRDNSKEDTEDTMGLFGIGKKSETEKKYNKLMSDALKDRSSSAGKAMAERKKEKNEKKNKKKWW